MSELVVLAEELEAFGRNVLTAFGLYLGAAVAVPVIAWRIVRGEEQR